jgi:hypothetical protein
MIRPILDYSLYATLVVCLLSSVVSTSDLDKFNYDTTVGNDYGPSDWIEVGCLDFQVCKGWPDAWEMAIEWELQENSWYVELEFV